MGALTSRLGLTTFEDSDQIDNEIFNANWQKLDAAPGVINVATESALPNNLGQAGVGRLAFVGSTKTLMYYQGPTASPAWLPVSGAPKLFTANTDLLKGTVTMSGVTTKSFATLGSYTAATPGTLFFQSLVQFDTFNPAVANLKALPKINRGDAYFGNNKTFTNLLGGYAPDYKQVTPDIGAVNSNISRSDQLIGYGVGSVAAGTGTFGVDLALGFNDGLQALATGGDHACLIKSIKIWALLVS